MSSPFQFKLRLTADHGDPRVSRIFAALFLTLAVISGTTVAQAFQVYGDIAIKWRALGGPSGPLGDVLSDEADGARGGRFNNFRNGFIYWIRSHGAHATYGLIGERWNSMGRERGTCGYPISDEYDDAGGRRSDFEHGRIIWRPGQERAVAICGTYQDDVVLNPAGD